jgi:Alpha-acetolactate decarboxylase.
MKRIFIILAMFFTACGGAQTNVRQESSFKVEHRGAMREMFTKNNIGGNIPLADFRDKQHLFAVAPLENLSGEITILDGVPYISSIRDNSVSVEKTWDAKAIFMVWAQVAEWSETDVPGNVKTYAELERFVAEAAKNAGIDTTEPFPLKLKGTPKKADWHINDYAADGSPVTREKHDQAKFKGTLENEAAEIAGFYSDKHAGVFTHHTTNMHLHIVSSSEKLAAHLDDIVLGENTKLFLPKP